MKAPHLALAIVLALLLAGVPASAEDTPAAASPVASEPSALTGPVVGSPAPPFSLTTLDGRHLALSSFAGKILVVNVWATWCPPCRGELPDLLSAEAKLRKNGVVFLGVDTTEQASIVRAYVAARNVPYLEAVDRDDAFASAYDVQNFPTTFVIDPHGILRARYVANITSSQLEAFTTSARAGENADVASSSPLQKKIDGLLSDPSIAYTGDAASVVANAKRADAAIAQAEQILDEAGPGDGDVPDLERTRVEEASLRDAAIAALVNAGTSVNDTSLLPRLRGDAALDREQWQGALEAYRAALELDPKNEDALEGVALAAARLKHYDAAIDADTKLAQLDPTDVGALVGLGIEQSRAGKRGDAYATFARAIAVAQRQVDANPGKPHPLRMLAYAHLYAGRTYVRSGDPRHARDEFAAALALAQKLPPRDARHDMYIEEAQEAIVALGLGGHHAGASVSLAPWTGADLPGSIPNTIRYRLIVAGSAGKQVALHAEDVPKGWVASFCSDRVCAPFSVTLSIPDSGVKVVEFQLVPPSAHDATPHVRVIGTDGARHSVATT
jgi:tetratricopeptide (TPR) repeat protein